MKAYFIVTVKFTKKNRIAYEEDISLVKPIVESFGGRFLVRTEQVIPLDDKWTPDRLIIAEFPSKELLEACFSSTKYQEIKEKRESTVEASAVIVEGLE